MATIQYKPVGIFWDIENCSVPKNKAASEVVAHLRNLFVFSRLNHREYEFLVACDVTRIRKDIPEDVNKAGGVTLAHVSGSSKNAADEKLRENMKKFVDTHSPMGVPVLVLISGDIDFVNDMRGYQMRLGCTIILIHSPTVSPQFKLGWNETYDFQQLCTGIRPNPAMGVAGPEPSEAANFNGNGKGAKAPKQAQQPGQAAPKEQGSSGNKQSAQGQKQPQGPGPKNQQQQGPSGPKQQKGPPGQNQQAQGPPGPKQQGQKQPQGPGPSQQQGPKQQGLGPNQQQGPKQQPGPNQQQGPKQQQGPGPNQQQGPSLPKQQNKGPAGQNQKQQQGPGQNVSVGKQQGPNGPNPQQQPTPGPVPNGQPKGVEYILMVSGLPGKLDYQILKAHLQEEADKVSGRVKFVKNGQAFITFKNQPNAVRAQQLFNGKEVYGKKLNVTFTKSIPFEKPGNFVMVNKAEVGSAGQQQQQEYEPHVEQTADQIKDLIRSMKQLHSSFNGSSGSASGGDQKECCIQ